MQCFIVKIKPCNERKGIIFGQQEKIKTQNNRLKKIETKINQVYLLKKC